MTSLLRCENLTVRLGRKTVIDGFTADFAAGTLAVLSGPNGAGKTTLLRTLARALAPSAGRVLLDGHPSAAIPRAAWARRVAYLPQSPDARSLAGFPVRAAVAAGRLPHAGFFGTLARRDEDAIDRALAATGLSPLAAADAGSLSGGETRKMFLAAALAQEAETLLLDEPFEGLDAPARAALADTLRAQLAAGRAVVLATHDLAPLAGIPHRVIEIKPFENNSKKLSGEKLVISHVQEGVGRAVPARRREKCQRNGPEMCGRMFSHGSDRMASAHPAASDCTFQHPAARGLAALPGFAQTKTQGFRQTTPKTKNRHPHLENENAKRAEKPGGPNCLPSLSIFKKVVPSCFTLLLPLLLAAALAALAVCGCPPGLLWSYRVPRLLCAFCVGGILAVAGCIYQTLFRNPLASPYTLGTASGATLGAYLATAFAPGLVSVGGAAFAGALLSLALVRACGGSGGRPARLLLGGIACAYLFGAGTMLCQFAMTPWESFSMAHWSLGGIVVPEGPWRIALPAAWCAALATVLLSRPLDALLAGDDAAFSHGLDPARLRFALLAGAALLVACAVAVCGPVGFVGLLVPHLARLAGGAAHRRLLPACAIGGGLFLALCDAAARALPFAGTPPVGIVTAVLGAPALALLLARSSR